MPSMLHHPVTSSFSSARTLEADSTSPSFGGEEYQVPEDEAKQACTFARAVLDGVQLPSPVKDLKEPKSEACLTTPKKSTTTANFFLPYKYPPTPEVTPEKSPKRSHALAFHDSGSSSAATSHCETTDYTTGTPTVKPAEDDHATCEPIAPTPTRRKLFHNTPKWSIASEGCQTITPVSPQSTHLPNPPTPISSHHSTPPPPDLQKLQEDLAKPLPSDEIPSPSASSSYSFRTARHPSLTSAVVIDEDETGTYDPNVQEWDEEDEEEDEVSTEEASSVDDDFQINTMIHDHGNKTQTCGVRLSMMEYARFFESLREQVSFTMVDQYVASNRGRKVFRQVLEDMFRERIEKA